VIHLTVRVIPRASRSAIAGVRDGALLVRLQSPPVEGAANLELIELIAGTFRVAKRNVTIESGERSKLKRVTIESIDRREFEHVLQSFGIDAHDLHYASSA
jgi:uncharacterized protein (TIGR00251 family)